MKYTISQNIFERFPQFQRGVVIAKEIDNSVSRPELASVLARESAIIATEDCKAPDSRLESWDQAYRSFGANPKSFSPSIKFLISQIHKGKPPRSINTLVDLFNIVSVRYRMPCGGDDLDAVGEGEIQLGFSTGHQIFAPLFRPDEWESVPAKEVIYFHSQTSRVMCRRWNWRNADFSRIRPETRNVAVNIDALVPPISRAILESATAEMAGFVARYCGGKVDTTILDPSHPSFTF